MSKQKSSLQTSTYSVQGMHCASCEILIEKRIIQEDSVKKVDASLSKETVTIGHHPDKKLTPDYLNKLFKADGYCFSVGNHCPVSADSPFDPFTSLLIGAAFIIAYLLLSQTGFSSLISINAQSALPIFFLFGLLAGVSSCAALVGGIVLSLSKQWLSTYSDSDPLSSKFTPHFLFNFGRVLGYAGFGAILGAAGNFFRLSPVVSAMLVISVSLIMILLGLQMIGIKALQRFQIRLPKSLTGKLSDESNFQSRFGPFLMGALTFFLPCGFTITAQALALTSSNPLQGALIMGLFALGTVPGLLAIGLSSVKLYSDPKLAKQFSLIAGMLVLFFAAFNIRAQLSVLGVSNPLTIQASQPAGELPPIISGTQVVKINASSAGYTPNRIRLRANTPTRWEVSTNNISGCTNAIISRGLFSGQIDLVDGQVSTKEFTSPKPGVYKFSCWMGMVSGIIEVVDSNGNSGALAPLIDSREAGVNSGGCGCGGGGTAGGTCGGI